MPDFLKSRIPPTETAGAWPAPRHPRRMLVLQGCVQPGLKPNINAATARVLDHIGISLIAADEAGCCGALAYHLNDTDAGLAAARRNIDAWLPHLEAGAEAVVMTASGCGVMVKDYGWLLRHDAAYADKAARISAATRDISEILAAERDALKSLTPRRSPLTGKRIAYHPPCTLQHGQKLGGDVEALLTDAGVDFNGIPIKQLSQAEKWRIGLAIGMALNPGLRVMSVKDGSLLDADSMTAVAKMAEEKDFQVWVEAVANEAGVGFYIEEGEIKTRN